MAAPTEFTIEQVVSIGDPWESNQAKRTDELLFEGDQRTWKAHRDASDPRPEAGQVLKGWKNADKGTFGVATGGKGGGGGGGRGGKSYDRSPDHPVQMARALHTSALGTAPTLIEQMLTLSIIPAPKSKDEYLTLVQGVATWVESTYPKAVLEQAAKADG